MNHRLLALGDSYTIGEGVEAHERWPHLLTAALRAEGIPLEEPVIVATTGWTTDELAAGIAASGVAGEFPLVSLLIGVNNQYRGRALEEYGEEFTGLLRRAIAFAAGEAGRVLVLSIPDWGVTPFAGDRDRPAIAAEIDRFNALARGAALAAGARWVDVTAHTRAHPELLVADGLHPSGEAYRAWSELALPQALTALTPGRPAPGPFPRG